MQAAVSAIGCNAEYGSQFEPGRTTHVVSAFTACEEPHAPRPLLVVKRTLKYMFGVLYGAHVVSSDWAAACVAAG